MNAIWQSLAVGLVGLACAGVGLQGSAGGNQDPSEIEGCVLWLDALDQESITLDENGLVARWQDKSGRAHHVSQELAAARPRIVNAGADGLGGVSFSGDDWLRTLGETPLSVGQGGISIIVVFETVEEHPLRFMGITGSGGQEKTEAGIVLGFNDRHVITQNNVAAFMVSDGRDYALNLGGDAKARKLGMTSMLNVQYPNLLSVTCGPENDPQANIYVYGQETGKALPPMVSTHWHWGKGWAVGAADRDGTHPFQGTISEVLVYDRALSPGERQAIEDGLRQKHGLTPPSPIVLHPRGKEVAISRAQAVAPDGTLLLLRNDRLYISHDGQTWEKRYECVRDSTLPHVPITGGLLVATPAGTLIHVVRDPTTFVKLTRKDGEFTSDEAQSLVYAMRSLDGGKTWTDAQLIQKGYCGAMRDVLVTSQGNIVVSLQKWDGKHERHVTTIHASADDGMTWAQCVLDNGIGQGLHDGFYESTVTELNDGRLWLLGRTSLGVFWQSYSEDGGFKWSLPTGTQISAGGYPGALLRLKSGRQVLVWNRYYPDGFEDRDDLINLAGISWFWGTHATSRFNRELSIMFSDDDGRTWTTPKVVAENRQDFIGPSYPHLLERRPGEIYIWARDVAMKVHENDWMTSRSR